MSDTTREMTAEDEARAMLARAGVKHAETFSSGDLVELANLIASRASFTAEDVINLRLLASGFSPTPERKKEILYGLADRIEALLPPLLNQDDGPNRGEGA